MKPDRVCSIADLKEYSKKIIQQMIEVWFVGLHFGLIITGIETVANIAILFVPNYAFSISIPIHLPELLAYIGAPVGGGILGYLLKSAFENREKIKNNPTYGGMPDDNSYSEADRFNLGQGGKDDFHSI